VKNQAEKKSGEQETRAGNDGLRATDHCQSEGGEAFSSTNPFPALVSGPSVSRFSGGVLVSRFFLPVLSGALSLAS